MPYCATKIDIAPENPDTTTVSGFFRAHFFECKYYNDQFDLHEGDMVFVSGKLTGECGIVDTVNYKFKINLADYERVIAHPEIVLHGTYAPVLDKMVSYAFHSGQPLC